jgi:hypothetical protein
VLHLLGAPSFPTRPRLVARIRGMLTGRPVRTLGNRAKAPDSYPDGDDGLTTVRAPLSFRGLAGIQLSLAPLQLRNPQLQPSAPLPLSPPAQPEDP